MKFDKILHPEIALDKRGVESVRSVYRSLLKDVSYSRTGFTVLPSDEQAKVVETRLGGDKFESAPEGKVLPGKLDGGEHRQSCFLVKQRLMKLDDNSRDHFCLVKKFIAESGKIYHVNKDFLGVLSEIDREIPVDCLPERFLGYISFADQTIKDETGYVQGAYVFIGDAKETSLREEEWGNKVFWCSYIEEGDSMTVTSLRTVLENKTMQDLICDLFSVDYLWRMDKDGNVVADKNERSLIDREVVFRTIINTIIYSHCQNPTLDRVPAKSSLSHSQAKKIKQITGLDNLASVPVTFINWKYERPIVYSKDKTSVIGHFRRQHFGPGNKLIKAIYIEEHERIFNKIF